MNWLFLREDFRCVLQLLHEDRLTCQYWMSSATVWLIWRVQTRSESTVMEQRTRSSAAEMWQIRPHMCGYQWRRFSFIFWFGWVTKQEPLLPLSVPKQPIKPITCTHLWQKLRNRKLKKAGAEPEIAWCPLSTGWRRKARNQKSVAEAAPKGQRDRSASTNRFYRRRGQTPNSTHKY